MSLSVCLIFPYQLLTVFIYNCSEYNLRDKMASAGCVVVTGAASGIGKHITMELVMKGRTTVLWDVDQVEMESEGSI